MPKVSVIIPTYNRANYLPEAIDSVLNQTYQGFEIIIVDDGSSDKTKEVVEEYIGKYPNKIKYFYQENKGPGPARNKGIKEAKGRFVAFLDSDDIWMPNKLEKQLPLFKNEKVGLAFSKAYVINQNKVIIGKKGEGLNGFSLNYQSLLIRNYLITSSTVVRRECFDKLGLFNPTYYSTQDYDLWLRIARCFKMSFTDEFLVKYRDIKSGVSKNTELAFLARIQILRKHFSSNPLVVKRIIAKKLYLLGKFYYSNKSYFKTFKCASKAIGYNPLLGKVFWQSADSWVSKIFKIIKPYGLVLASLCLFLMQSYKVKKIKRILLYETSSGFGGSAGALVNLINSLNKKRFYPIVVIKNYGFQIKKIRDAEIIKLRDYKEPDNLSNLELLFYFIRNILSEVISLYFIIKTKRIALAHINTNVISGIPLIIASKVAGIPCVCHIRQTRRPIKREKFFFKWVNAFIFLNKDAYEMYKQDIPEQKLRIIHDSINLEEFSKVKYGKFRKEFNLNSSPVIGVVGRIVKGKGQKEFILSAREILKIRPDLKFAIVGDAKGDEDRYYKEVKELVRKENLGKKIIFTGWRNDIRDVIADLDILIQPVTSPEGFGMVLLEAMLLKKPIIVSNISGPTEIITDGVCGFLVAPGDIKAIAEKTIYLLEYPEIAKAMGEKGRKKVDKLFDIRVNIIELENVYKNLI